MFISFVTSGLLCVNFFSWYCFICSLWSYKMQGMKMTAIYLWKPLKRFKLMTHHQKSCFFDDSAHKFLMLSILWCDWCWKSFPSKSSKNNDDDDEWWNIVVANVFCGFLLKFLPIVFTIHYKEGFVYLLNKNQHNGIQFIENRQ